MTVDKIKSMSTADDLLSDSVYIEIAEEQSEVERDKLIAELLDRAKALKCLQKVKNRVSAWKKETKQAIKSAAIEQVQSYSGGETQFAYENYEFECGPFQADENGIILVTPFGNHLACYHPILVKKVLRNAETDKEKVRLAYKKGGKDWQEITVDRSIVASASKIIALADYGLSVDSETAKYLVRFLSYIENHNISLIEYGKSTSKFGWIGNDFTPYDERIEFDAINKFPEIYRSVHEHKGSFDVWLDLVKSLRKGDRDEPMIYMAGAFASVLLKPLNALPFILNLWGETGKGKTVALMVACSVWADPSENRYITDPSSTTVSIEIREDLLNNLPIMIDDLSKVKDGYKKDDGFTDFIYMLCGGKGKDRSNINLGLNKTTTWQNVCLTNIERPLSTETMRGGAINRILDFEMGEGSIFENGNKVVGIVSKNYGFAGEMFVRIVQEMDKKELKDIYEGYITKIKDIAFTQGVEKEEKQIIPLAVMLTADKIATDHIFQDGVYLDIKKCVETLKNKGDVSENERAYNYLKAAVAINSNKFIKKTEEHDDGTADYKPEYWGKIQEQWTIFIPTIFDRLCEEGNFSRKAFLQWAAKRGLINCGKKGNESTMTRSCRINGVMTRCIWLYLPDGEIDGDGFIDVSGQEPLPFE